MRLVVDAAHALGISVCAEGIEDLEQARHLLAMGCDTAQGWLFGRPQAVTPALLPFLMHGGAVSSALKGAAAQDTVMSIYR